MKIYRKLAALIIIGALVVALVSTFTLINVQRGMGEKQDKLLGQVKNMNTIVESILPDFTPTVELADKTEGMVADLKALNSTVLEMNSIVVQINDALNGTISWLDTDNQGLDTLAVAMGGALGPLNNVGASTATTLDLLNKTVAALSAMSSGLGSTNWHASRVSSVMTGGSAQ